MTAEVTIGMPVRNGAEYVDEAIQSLLAQTEGDFILHISDNNSDDSTPEICARLAAEDPRISYERHEHNLGMTRNFEHVLSAAETPFFMWAAHDDLWAPTFLATSLNLLRAAPGAVTCAAGMRLIDSLGAELERAIPPVALTSMSPIDRVRAINEPRYFVNTMILYGLMRREKLPSSMSIGDYLAADVALTFNIALNGRIVITDEVLLSYRVSDYEVKRQGEEAHWYQFDHPRTQMCRSMAQDISRAPLSKRDKAMLRFHVARLWLVSARAALKGRNGEGIRRALVTRRHGIVLLRRTVQFILAPKQMIAGLRRRIAHPSGHKLAE